jgi:hypothetical protein
MDVQLAVLRRVGQVLLVFCGLHLFAFLGDVMAQQAHAFIVDGLTGGLGLMLACGRLGGSRRLALVHALTLIVAAAGAVVLVVALGAQRGAFALPPDCAHEWLQRVWSAGWWLADLVLTLWIVCALLPRPSSLAAPQPPRSHLYSRMASSESSR